MQSLLVGGASVLAGVALAAATAFGVVQTTSGSFDPDESVLEYGTNQ